MRVFKWVCAVLVILSASLVFAQGPEPGSAGIGDPYYPDAGNGGYDVQHYQLDLNVDVEKNVLDGVATIDAKATQDLSAFNFDLRALEVSAVTVNGADATFDQNGQNELTITPADPINTDDTFTVVITYGGTPEPVADPSLAGAQLGWVKYSGGTFVTSEPMGAAVWYPVNDHPSDKATYTYQVTVPKPYVVAANGVLSDTVDNGDTTTYVWDMTEPMASYLATVDIAQFVEQNSEGPNGLPIRNYFPADKADQLKEAFAGTSEWIATFEDLFGPYPFDDYGVVVIDQNLGFALETQTLSTFSADNVIDGTEVVPGLTNVNLTAAHELSHQWFGDSISLERWQDIWLNEGFATYAEALLIEHYADRDAARNYINQLYFVMLVIEYSRDPNATVGDLIDAIKTNIGEDYYNQNLASQFDRMKDTPMSELAYRFGIEGKQAVLIGDPGPDDLFSIDVYYRGGLTLEALRDQVGDDAFFNILKTYVERYSYSNVTTDDFIAVAEEVSGQQLDDLFKAWLFTEALPPLPAVNK